jgi:EAL domain-containing protein (putative c-di-GMP-specific phosphodiesterase class I)
VETVEQAEELAGLGATFLQGFSLGRPMSGRDLTTWFAAHRETPETPEPTR